MRRFGGLIWAAPMAIIIVVIDQLSKRWALDRLTPGRCDLPDSCIDLILGARFHLVFNTGAAFARGQGLGPLLAVLVSIIAVVLLIVAWKRTDKTGALLLGAVAGGAIGNLVDRVTRAEDGFLSGAVVDFIDLGWWPVFNIADAAVVCGVLGFVVLSWLDGSSATEPDFDDSGGPRKDDPASTEYRPGAQSGSTTATDETPTEVEAGESGTASLDMVADADAAPSRR